MLIRLLVTCFIFAGFFSSCRSQGGRLPQSSSGGDGSSHSSSDSVQSQDEEAAATKLQALYRGKKAKKEVAELKEKREKEEAQRQEQEEAEEARKRKEDAEAQTQLETESATKIQALYRGKKGREKASEERGKKEEEARKQQQEEAEAQAQLEARSATKLQALYRGKQERDRIAQEERLKQEYEDAGYTRSCNFVYINRDVAKPEQQYVFDRTWKVTFHNFLEMLDEWKAQNPDCRFKIWTDKRMITDKIFADSKDLLEGKKASLHDLNDIPFFQIYPETLDSSLDVFLRVDFSRTVVLDYEVRTFFPGAFYADLDILPLALRSDIDGIQFFGFGLGAGDLISAHTGLGTKRYENSVLYLQRNGLESHRRYIVEAGRAYLTPHKSIIPGILLMRAFKKYWRREYHASHCLGRAEGTIERKLRGKNLKREKEMMYFLYDYLLGLKVKDHELETGENFCVEDTDNKNWSLRGYYIRTDKMPIIPGAEKAPRD